MNMQVESIGAVPMSAGVRVKLCGMTREEDVRAVNAALPDMCGFVVEVAVRRRSVSATRAVELAHGLDERIAAVAVVRDNPLDDVVRLVESGAFRAVQLHGHEDDEYVRRVLGTGTVVIQAFSVASATDVARANASRSDLVLLDNGAAGTGETFDWSLLEEIARPFMLAGGLGPLNTPGAIRACLPFGLWGVDMSSGIETDGAKDEKKIKAAVAAVRSCML